MRKNTSLVLLVAVLLALSLTVALMPFTSTARAATNTANVTCKTQDHQGAGYDTAIGAHLFWLDVKTTWCYNGITVTSHSTILSWGTTGPGSVEGWQYIGNPQYSFNCYVAAGAPTGGGCSGNHEHADEQFANGGIPGCHLVVDTEENYKGQFFWHDSMYGVAPGYCSTGVAVS